MSDFGSGIERYGPRFELSGRASKADLRRRIAALEAERKELRLAMRNLSEKYNEISVECERRHEDRLHYLHKCRSCNAELPWTDGTDTEYWCQSCGKAQPATWTEVRWAAEALDLGAGAEEGCVEPRKGLCVECGHYLSAFRTCAIGLPETCNRNWPNARCPFTPSRWVERSAP